jgi:hypothetical protein
MSDYNTQPQGMAEPDPALRRLGQLIGTWSADETVNVSYDIAGTRLK